MEDRALGPDRLAICLNSLPTVGGAAYNIVVFDEAGLTRRHFLSATIKDMERLHERFSQIVAAADTVLIMQQGLATEDVSFYTNITNDNCEDRGCVAARDFVRPIRVHPIEHREDIWDAICNLNECYLACFDPQLQGGGLLDADGFKICTNPFIVFTNSCTLAEYIVTALRERAAYIGANPERVKGIWAALKDTCEFCRRFASTPNAVAPEVDVIVCTSVIGAGFSINTHFVAFHAFLLTGILSFDEEQQLIQRLRLVLDTVPVNATRQSYVFIEKSRGKPVSNARISENSVEMMKALCILGRRDYNTINFDLLTTKNRITTDRSATSVYHGRLWKDLGETFESTYKVIVDPEPLPTGAKLLRDNAKCHFRDWVKSKSKSVASWMTMVNLEEIGYGVTLVEAEHERQLFLATTIENCAGTLDRIVGEGYFQVSQCILLGMYASPEKFELLIASPAKIRRIFQPIKNFVIWLRLHSGGLEDQSHGLWDTWAHKHTYGSSALKHTAIFHALKAIKHIFHDRTTPLPPFLESPSEDMFFGHLMITCDQHCTLHARLRQLLLPTEESVLYVESLNVSRNIRRDVKTTQEAMAALFGLHGTGTVQVQLEKLLLHPANPQQKVVLFKHVQKAFHSIGVSCDRKRKASHNGRRLSSYCFHIKPTTVSLALCLRGPCRQALTTLIPYVYRKAIPLSTTNHENFCDGVRLFKDHCARQVPAVDPGLPYEDRPGDDIRLYLRHSATERTDDNGVDDPEDAGDLPVHPQRQQQHQALMEEAYINVAAAEEHWLAQEQARLEALPNHDNDTTTDDDESESEPSRKRTRSNSRYVDDEAGPDSESE